MRVTDILVTKCTILSHSYQSLHIAIGYPPTGQIVSEFGSSGDYVALIGAEMLVLSDGVEICAVLVGEEEDR